MNTATHIVAPRMQSLQKLEKSLKRLDLSWKVIETTARVVGPPDAVGFVATLEHTRLAFSRLASEMVAQIALTHLENCQHDLASRAQVAIDILVRNLFERTADVGFIATDGPLVSYVLAPHARAASGLQARLAEYRNKYTVYDDILVLDAQAQIVLSLQPRQAMRTERPAWWAQATRQQGYVEVYGASGLFDNAGDVLLYAHCIVSPAGEVCGAVVLKFDLQSELRSIFKALQHEAIVILLLDAHARVVASSDADSFVASEAVDVPKDGAPSQPTLRHGGVEYLFAHCSTRGYQGYGGPGWTALALVRLDQAFDAAQGPATPQVQAEPDAASAIEIELNNAALHQIIARARAIEEDLNRVIWNGKLSGSSTVSGSALGPVFAEIGRTSQQTIAAFDGAIQELKSLLLLGRRAELAAHAALAVDIMDRNLYERANDCRWWALSEEFAELLQTLQAGPSEVAVQRAGEILAHLNSLYTVYRRVALFDRQGRILAVSKDAQSLAPDAAITAALLQSTLALRGTQAYAVSDMEPHALANGAATYLYCAPIRRAGTEAPLGGIALAFNCTDELKAMLQDSLPVGATALGVFVDRAGRVLASTHAGIAVGEVPDFASGLQTLATDTGAAPLCQWQGRSYLVGLARSKGYREFKTSDGYCEDVQSVLLTAVDASPQKPPTFVLPQPRVATGVRALHYGVVQCGKMLFALSGGDVMEAVSTAHMAAPAAASDMAGLLKYTLDGQRMVLPVYDSCKLTGQAPLADPARAVAVVVRGQHHPMALLVDRLVDVVACDSLAPPPGGINPQTPWLQGFIHDSEAHTEPVFALDPKRLLLVPEPLAEPLPEPA
jgi:chemotaxis signal transduction protein